MDLGNFSVSLAVKDIDESRAFYERLGFTVWGGDQSQNWLILKNGSTVLGLFQGMFERNILTFNPGWDSDANTLSEFTDVRDLQRSRFGFEGELFKKRQELIKPVQDKVYNAVQKLAVQRGYDFILDKSEGITVIFADPKLEKSEDVLRELGVK